MCLMQSRANVAEGTVLVNSVVSDDVHVDSSTAVIHCHLMSPIYVNSGCIITGLNDCDIPVSGAVFASSVHSNQFENTFSDEFFICACRVDANDVETVGQRTSVMFGG